MTLPRIMIDWSQREDSLSPVGVVAVADTVPVLGERILRDDFSESFQRLEAITADRLLAVFGAEADLPWVDGVTYLGKDPSAPQLLLPTNLSSSVPLDIVARGLKKSFPDVRPPLVFLPVEQLVISASAARSISRERLAGWLESIK